MEELATSSFSQALGWQIFFSCTLAVLTVDTFRSAQRAFVEGQFGLFDGEAGTVLFEVRTVTFAILCPPQAEVNQSTAAREGHLPAPILRHQRITPAPVPMMQVQTQLSNHVAAMAPAAIIGLACGVLAIAFTAVNLKVARLREAVLTKKSTLRMAEPCVIMAVFVTLGMLLPLAFPCTPTSCVVREGETEPSCPPGVTTHVK